ncbi:MAG: LytTR family transcriptional regulator DNA-binding domain-containing protein [Actinomycetaceae bacterium]|nr:LytTR family transcriptional regulator DNA-binding domain-containing protein [Actinomycetaceae bacterium]
MDKEHDNASRAPAIPVSIKIAADAPSPRVVIYTSEVSDEVRELAQRIGSITGTLGRREFLAYDGEHVILVPFSAIYSIYARDKKVYVRTSNAHYRLKMTLREAEEAAQGTRLIRISKSEIVNFHKVRKLDMSLAGTIVLLFDDGEKTYVARRYVSRIKETLGVK